jgi:hypothetical protein
MENQEKSLKGRSIAQWVRTSKNSCLNAFQQFTLVWAMSTNFMANAIFITT